MRRTPCQIVAECFLYFYPEAINLDKVGSMAMHTVRHDCPEGRYMSDHTIYFGPSSMALLQIQVLLDGIELFPESINLCFLLFV